MAVATAKALVADKLVYFTDLPVLDKRGKVIADISALEADKLLANANNLSDDTRLFMAHAVEAVRGRRAARALGVSSSGRRVVDRAIYPQRLGQHDHRR